MKNFCKTLSLIVIILCLQVIKYFVSYPLFYLCLILQIGLFIICLVSLFKNIAHKKITIAVFILAIICVFIPTFISFYETPTVSKYVIHAGGGDEYTYLNCKEPFMHFVSSGYEYVEVDFLYTKDNYIVASHEFEHLNGYNLHNRPTLAEFENYKLEEKFSGITFDWLLNELSNFPNVKIIFDTKENDLINIIDDMVKIAKEKNFDIFSRFIIQIYSVENYYSLKEKYDFETYWFTNYKAHYPLYKIKEYFEDKDDVETIVLSFFNWLNFNQINFHMNKKIAVHTIDNENIIHYLANHGVEYIYINYDKKI